MPNRRLCLINYIIVSLKQPTVDMLSEGRSTIVQNGSGLCLEVNKLISSCTLHQINSWYQILVASCDQ